MKQNWVGGQLIEAVKKGHVVIYDEFSRSRPETNNIFLSLLEEKVLPIYGKGKESFIKCHPEFTIIFTSNPEEYAGTFHTPEALLDRLILIHVDYCDQETEEKIIRQKTGVNQLQAKEIVRLVSILRLYGKGTCPSLRASIMIASIAKKMNIPIIPEDKQYQKLCLDVLTRPVKQIFPELNRVEVEEFILKELVRNGRTSMSVYVFCVIPEKNQKKFGKVTINGQENEIYTIHQQNTAMVVTKVTDEVLPDRHNLYAHQQTIS